MARCTVPDCDRLARGAVEPGTLAPRHTCKQCSEDHCQMERYYQLEWQMAEQRGEYDWYMLHLIKHTSS